MKLQSDCVFCNIVSGVTPAEVLFQNEQAIAVLDINPIHYGHALVIPKQHCKDFLELPAETFPSVLQAAQVVARALVASLNLQGYNLFSNNGESAGQSVFHFHLHVTPRYNDDDIRFVLKLKQYPNGELKRYGDMIRKCIH